LDRKALIREYKQNPLPAGVFVVRNTSSGRSLVQVSTNLPGSLNRQRFQLELGAHPNKELQRDWNDLGPDAFAIEALDLLEPPEDIAYDQTEDLEVLKQMWTEKLAASGCALY